MSFAPLIGLQRAEPMLWRPPRCSWDHQRLPSLAPAGSLQASLERLRATHSDANLVSAVTQMVTKPMTVRVEGCVFIGRGCVG